jgi:HTH-type transcriptional regulator/antitoxin HipB
MTLRGEMKSPKAMGRILAQGHLLRGLSQRELAKELGIDQKYVWSMEQGKPSLYTERLFAMMRGLDVSKPRSRIPGTIRPRWPTGW